MRDLRKIAEEVAGLGEQIDNNPFIPMKESVTYPLPYSEERFSDLMKNLSPWRLINLWMLEVESHAIAFFYPQAFILAEPFSLRELTGQIIEENNRSKRNKKNPRDSSYIEEEESRLLMALAGSTQMLTDYFILHSNISPHMISICHVDYSPDENWLTRLSRKPAVGRVVRTVFALDEILHSEAYDAFLEQEAREYRSGEVKPGYTHEVLRKGLEARMFSVGENNDTTDEVSIKHSASIMVGCLNTKRMLVKRFDSWMYRQGPEHTIEITFEDDFERRARRVYAVFSDVMQFYYSLTCNDMHAIPETPERKLVINAMKTIQYEIVREDTSKK